MLNALEDKIMVYHINDAANPIKSIDTEHAMKIKQQDLQKPVTSHSDASDSVNFSSTSKQLEALKASLRDVPEINEARVMYFKAEIQSGNYQINSDKIANKLLNEEMA